MAVTPLPRISVSGVIAADGTLNLSFSAPSLFYAACYLAISSSLGSPALAIHIGPAAPLIFGVGAQTNLGPVVLYPGEQATVAITGGTPDALVVGQVMGWQSTLAEELLPFLPLTPSAISVVGPPPALGTTLILSDGFTRTITPPTGAVAAIVNLAPAGLGTTLKLTGGQTGFVYLSDGAGGGMPVRGLWVVILAGDTTLTRLAAFTAGSPKDTYVQWLASIPGGLLFNSRFGCWEFPATATVFPAPAGAGVNNAASLAVWTPAAGRRFRILRLTVMGSIAGAYQVQDGGATIDDFQIVANGPHEMTLPPNGYLSLARNNALTVVNSSGAVSSMRAWVTGREEPSLT